MSNKPVTNQEFAVLLNNAHKAGLKAGNAFSPTPMVVAQHSNVLDDSSPVTKSWYVEDGVCGFAWVTTREHGNGKFVKYLKKMNNSGSYLGYSTGHKYYYGGHYVTMVHEYGQSMQKKAAYASAFAGVLKEAGLDCCSGSRMD